MGKLVLKTNSAVKLRFAIEIRFVFGVHMGDSSPDYVPSVKLNVLGVVPLLSASLGKVTGRPLLTKQVNSATRSYHPQGLPINPVSREIFPPKFRFSHLGDGRVARCCDRGFVTNTAAIFTYMVFPRRGS